MSKARGRREEVLRWLAVRQREGLTYEELARRSGIPRNTLTSWSSVTVRRAGPGSCFQRIR